MRSYRLLVSLGLAAALFAIGAHYHTDHANLHHDLTTAHVDIGKLIGHVAVDHVDAALPEQVMTEARFSINYRTEVARAEILRRIDRRTLKMRKTRYCGAFDPDPQRSEKSLS